jgi:AcrR family transcriptional regulator
LLVSRPCSISRDDILDAARKVFLRHGFTASTAQVARAAGISEGSLFKHFKTKNALFLAALGTEITGSTWQDTLQQSAGKGNVRRTLESVGRQMLSDFRILLPHIMMIRSSGIVLTGPHQGRTAPLPHPAAKLHALTAYFRAEIREGHLEMANPTVQAQVFFSAFANYAFQECVFGFRTAAPSVYIRTVADMILCASEPAGRLSPAAGSKRGAARFRTSRVQSNRRGRLHEFAATCTQETIS